MICKNCHEKIDNDSSFCPSCGAKVNIDENVKKVDVEKEFLDHLEFLGFEINKIESENNLQRYSAIHKTRPNLVFNAIENIGISFVSFYKINKEKVSDNHKEALELINRVNNQALFCSFSISPDLNNFVCGALYLGKYNKKLFADFLDVFESDIQGRLKTEDYLKIIT